MPEDNEGWETVQRSKARQKTSEATKVRPYSAAAKLPSKSVGRTPVLASKSKPVRKTPDKQLKPKNQRNNTKSSGFTKEDVPKNKWRNRSERTGPSPALSLPTLYASKPDELSKTDGAAQVSDSLNKQPEWKPMVSEVIPKAASVPVIPTTLSSQEVSSQSSLASTQTSSIADSKELKDAKDQIPTVENEIDLVESRGEEQEVAVDKQPVYSNFEHEHLTVFVNSTVS